jgi:hypothetical protein
MRNVSLIALVLLLVALLVLPAAQPVLAQPPTPTNTPVPSATPIWLFGVPITLPTSWPGVPRTPIPIHYTPAPNLNPLGLDIDSGDIVLETVNMKTAIFDVMGVTGQVLNFIITLALVFWGSFALIGIFRKTQRMVVAIRSGEWASDEAIGRRLGRMGDSGLKGLKGGKRL